MVVDDEPELVGLSLELLQGLGYAPDGYIDPVAALDAFRADAASFDAIVTDELMPGLSGIQLAEAAHRLVPALPVLLVSGYGGALVARRAVAAGVSRVLAKPLQRAELARALAAILPP
jgi:CheY-like chemotaxis protein